MDRPKRIHIVDLRSGCGYLGRIDDTVHTEKNRSGPCHGVGAVCGNDLRRDRIDYLFLGCLDVADRKIILT